MTWHRNRMAVYDLETTAPDPEEARIVSSCLGGVSGGLPPNLKFTIVNPGVEIPQEAIDIHGISNERVRDEGREPGEVVTELSEWITAAWVAGVPLVAFNAAYDFTVLDRESRRHLGKPLEIDGPVIDPFVIDRQVDKYRKGKRTLAATVEVYGVRLDGAHDATEDALAAGRVAWAIAERYPEIAAMSLEDLHEAQIGWHAERQRDFAAYLIRSGESAAGVSEHWPLRPFALGVAA